MVMTATDELRELLDERGVEHEDNEDVTRFFGPDGFEVVMQEDIDGKLDCLTPIYLTPEQAVEATLGRGTCRMTRVEDEERILHGWMECSECGPVYPPAAERIQDAVKFCPFCGRRVVEE